MRPSRAILFHVRLACLVDLGPRPHDGKRPTRMPSARSRRPVGPRSTRPAQSLRFASSSSARRAWGSRPAGLPTGSPEVTPARPQAFRGDEDDRDLHSVGGQAFLELEPAPIEMDVEHEAGRSTDRADREAARRAPARASQTCCDLRRLRSRLERLVRGRHNLGGTTRSFSASIATTAINASRPMGFSTWTWKPALSTLARCSGPV